MIKFITLALVSAFASILFASTTLALKQPIKRQVTILCFDMDDFATQADQNGWSLFLTSPDGKFIINKEDEFIVMSFSIQEKEACMHLAFTSPINLDADKDQK